MARLPRATFALLLALLPACAAVIGFVVLRQRPHAIELVAIALIVVGVAVHQDEDANDALHRKCAATPLSHQVSTEHDAR